MNNTKCYQQFADMIGLRINDYRQREKLPAFRLRANEMLRF